MIATLGGALWASEQLCWSCDTPLLKNNTEKHHFPIAKRNGGDETVCLCTSCHNMIDRIPLSRWPLAEVILGIHEMPKEVRCLILKIIKIGQDNPQ